jgi:hypothetical protein
LCILQAKGADSFRHAVRNELNRYVILRTDVAYTSEKSPESPMARTFGGSRVGGAGRAGHFALIAPVACGIVGFPAS